MILLLSLAVATQATGIDRAVTEGIREGLYPGAVAVVGTRDRILLAKGYGHFTWSDRSPAPDPEATLFDLASLTKVVATTPAVMLLVDRGRVDLDQPVGRYLPEFHGAGKERVRVRDLLEHRSGLRAGLRLDTLARDAGEARRLVLAEALRWPAGTRTVYSDLNAMLLAWIVEAVSGMPLDRFIDSELFAPAGMRETRFNPARALHDRVAPVGRWRGQPVAGAVHDQNAAKLGGVAGHAGLFATGADLARYAQLVLSGGRAPSGRQLVRPETVEQFRSRGPANRALGWEMRDPGSTDNTGSALSAAAFGHTGFTGTSLWLDPERGLFVVLLTNRVFAPRVGQSISRLKRVRGAVADAAVELFDAACGPRAAATAAAC